MKNLSRLLAVALALALLFALASGVAGASGTGGSTSGTVTIEGDSGAKFPDPTTGGQAVNALPNYDFGAVTFTGMQIDKQDLASSPTSQTANPIRVRDLTASTSQYQVKVRHVSTNFVSIDSSSNFAATISLTIYQPQYHSPTEAAPSATPPTNVIWPNNSNVAFGVKRALNGSDIVVIKSIKTTALHCSGEWWFGSRADLMIPNSQVPALGKEYVATLQWTLENGV